MILHTMPQRSPEWRAVRLGNLTASRAADMLATIKTGEAAARRDLRVQLVVERLTGQPAEEGFVSADMQRGIDLELTARQAWESHTGELANDVGFVELEDCAAGCSPDGLVDGGVGLVQIKCPKSATMLGYWKAGTMPSAYVPQMLHEMWVTGAAWYSFCAYDDRLPARLRLFVVRTERRDIEDQIAAYAEKARAFLGEVDRETEYWRGRA